MSPQQVLTVIRHGKRLDEVESFWRETAERPWDPPLWSEGLIKVEIIAEQLVHQGFQRIVVSPFQRCLETARLLNQKLGLPYDRWQIDPAVCEVLHPKTLVGTQIQPPVGIAREWMWGKGTLQAALVDILGETDAAAVTVSDNDFPSFPETADDAHVRYQEAFQAIADRFPGENVLVVSHGEAVGRAVSRIMPHVLVYDVQHCGYATAVRQKDEVGDWDLWQLDEDRCVGVHWTER